MTTPVQGALEPGVTVDRRRRRHRARARSPSRRRSRRTAANGDVTGFVVAHARHRHAPDPVLGRRRPSGARDRAGHDAHAPGHLQGDDERRRAQVSRYRYPTSGDVAYPGPEVVYRVHVARPIANFGVAVLSGHAVPHVVFAGDENHLVGFPGLPTDAEPVPRTSARRGRSRARSCPRPAPTTSSSTRARQPRPGAFAFRFWMNDTTPPKLRILSASAGTSPSRSPTAAPGSIRARSRRPSTATRRACRYRHGRLTFHADRGQHLLIVVTASDYQELKNMEDVAKIKPNTATLHAHRRRRLSALSGAWRPARRSSAARRGRARPTARTPRGLGRDDAELATCGSHACAGVRASPIFATRAHSAAPTSTTAATSRTIANGLRREGY